MASEMMPASRFLSARVLTTWQLASPTASDPRDQGGSSNVVDDLASKVTSVTQSAAHSIESSLYSQIFNDFLVLIILYSFLFFGGLCFFFFFCFMGSLSFLYSLWILITSFWCSFLFLDFLYSLQSLSLFFFFFCTPFHLIGFVSSRGGFLQNLRTLSCPFMLESQALKKLGEMAPHVCEDGDIPLLTQTPPTTHAYTTHHM